MSAVVHDLMLDLVAWLRPRPRPYAEAMEAWRTSCPRLTVWEDAMEAGWIACETDDGVLRVRATAQGLAQLEAARRPHHRRE